MDELSYWLNFDPLAAQPVRTRADSRRRHLAGGSRRSQATATTYSSGLSNGRYQPRHRTEPAFSLPELPDLPHLVGLPSRLPHPSIGHIGEPALVLSSVATLVLVSTLGAATHGDSDKLTSFAFGRTDSQHASRGGASLAERYGVNAGFDSSTTTATPAPSTSTTTAPPPTTTTTAAPKPTTTTAAPKPKPAPAPKAADSGPSGDDAWQKLAQCEAGGRNDTGAPYYGYFQFSAQTWKAAGGTGLPSDHSYDEQKAIAQKLQAKSGWGQWPACSKTIGVR